MINAIKTLLNQILCDDPPTSILCVGESVGDAISTFLSKHHTGIFEQLDVAQMDERYMMNVLADKTFDFGVVANTIEHLDKSMAEHLLARLRDMHTRKLLLVVPIGNQWKNHCSHWEEKDLLALGFILKAKSTIDGKPVHVYAFDIASYKTTPDWLNDKYWANPNLWDKFWW